MDETFHIVDTGTVKPKGFKRFRRRRFTPNRWWNRNAQKKNVAEQVGATSVGLGVQICQCQ